MRSKFVGCDNGVLVVNDRDAAFIQHLLRQAKLLIELFDQPQRLFAIEDELVAVYSAVPHRELHQAAGYAALVHTLVGVLGQLHGQPLFFHWLYFSKGRSQNVTPDKVFLPASGVWSFT